MRLYGWLAARRLDALPRGSNAASVSTARVSHMYWISTVLRPLPCFDGDTFKKKLESRRIP